ncbi:MAG: DUF2213 domain-containing protein [Dehalococcoidales bacterium]
MTERIMLSIHAEPDVSAIRTATLFDEDHTIVPCIALVEGVLWPANAPAPELALAEEFGRFPDSWNGRPVVFDHPKVNGEAVSASDPKVMEEVAFGQLFNTVVTNGKLKVEIWINEDRVKGMSQEVQDTVARLKAGDETVEVSTGLFTMSEQAEGEFDGEAFEAIWRNIVPDHLAILPEGVTGACSVEDGCGAPRTNYMVVAPDGVSERRQEVWVNGAGIPFTPVMRAARMITTDTITTTASSCDCDEPGEEKVGIFQKFMELAGEYFPLMDSSAHLSDMDTRTAVQGALSESESFFWIVALFSGDDDEGIVVFEDFDTGKLFEREYKINDDGLVTIGEGRTEVRPVTQFVAVKPGEESETEVTDNTIHFDNASGTQTQENTMNEKDQLVTDLIANEATSFEDGDRDWLTALDESQLAKLTPVTNDVEMHTIGEEEVVEEELTPVSTEDYIAAAPEEVQSVLNEGLKMHRSRKDVLIKALLANARNQFTEDTLNAKSVGELEGLAALAQDISYEGQGGVATITANADDNAAPPAPQLFDLSKTADAA